MIFEEPKQTNTDIVIIGSGIGAVSVASALATAGKSFTVIEAGGINTQAAELNVQQVGRPFNLRSTTCYSVGGTSNLWHGLLAPLDKRDFETRTRGRHSLGWPISRDELVPHYERATQFLSTGKYSLGDADFALTSPPKTGLRSLDAIADEKLYFQPRPRRNLQKYILSITKKSARHHLLLGARVLAVQKTGASGVEITVGHGSRIYSLRYNTVIISAGALGSPRILLNSGLGGNSVGRYLADHPMAPLVTLRLERPKDLSRYTGAMQSGNYVFRGLKPNQGRYHLNMNLMMRPSVRWGTDFHTERLKNSLLCFRDGGVSARDIWDVARNVNEVRQILQYKWLHSVNTKTFDLLLVAEQTPNYDSRVLLISEKDQWGFNKVAADWRLNDSDQSCVKKLYSEITSFIEGHDYCAHRNHEYDWDQRFTSAAHHSGTCRMGSDLETSVVDSDCSLHNQQSIYVCDASVIPVNGCANLGLTISALGFRLGHHLSLEHIN